MVLSFLLRIILYKNGYNYDPWTYRFFPTELFFFLVGAICYKIYKYTELRVQKIEFRKILLNVLYISVIIFTVFYSFIDFKNKYYIYIILFSISLPFIFQLSKNWKIDLAVGELSYPIYISHMFVITCMNINLFKLPPVNGLNASITTIFIAFLLNEFIAKNVEKFRQRRIKK
jgi:peptidoglycan/LPS O-acetylase OafA/YrhL